MNRKSPINSLRKFLLGGRGMTLDTGKYAFEAVFLGLAAGLVTSAFYWLIVMGETLSARVANPYIRFFMPAAGAVLGCLAIKRFSRVSMARGTDSAVRAYHHSEDIPRTVIPVKSVASVLTVASGGSAGYEGPVTLLGAACGRVVSRLLRLDRHASRILLAAGLGAGISALFRAPLAGAIFSAEIFYSSSDIEYDVLLPSFVASATSYAVFAFFFGWSPLFAMPPRAFGSGLHLLPHLALAFVIAFGARFYIVAFRGTERFFSKLKWPDWTKVAAGGLAVGALSLLAPDVGGAGYGMVRRLLASGGEGGAGAAASLVAFFAVKAVATSFTVGSGGSGGVFAPAIACGGALGMASGLVFKLVLPDWAGIHPPDFALAGMAGFLAASVRTPLAAIVMVAEISGNHELLLPTMWVCGIAFWLNSGWTLYRSQVHSRALSPVHPS